jgi:hypothetical protein
MQSRLDATSQEKDAGWLLRDRQLQAKRSTPSRNDDAPQTSSAAALIYYSTNGRELFWLSGKQLSEA